MHFPQQRGNTHKPGNPRSTLALLSLGCSRQNASLPAIRHRESLTSADSRQNIQKFPSPGVSLAFFSGLYFICPFSLLNVSHSHSVDGSSLLIFPNRVNVQRFVFKPCDALLHCDCIHLGASTRALHCESARALVGHENGHFEIILKLLSRR